MPDSTRALPPPASGGDVPPPRRRQSAALHLTALQLVALLGLLPLAAAAVALATTSRRRLPPRGARRGRPRTYADATILLVALLARLWQLSTREVCAWLRQWPALADACGLPQGRVIHPAHLSRRARALGPLPCALLFLLLVEQALRAGLIAGRDVVLDSTFLATWRRRDPGAGWSRPVDKGGRLGYKVHLLLDRRARLPILFLLTSAQRNDGPLAYPLLWAARLVFRLPLRLVRADGAYWSWGLWRFITRVLDARCLIPFNRKWLPLDAVPFLTWWPIGYALRAAIERFFAVAKRYYGLDTAHAAARDAVLRRTALTFAASLAVALAAHRCGAPDLRLSPTRVLAHALPAQERL
jgi:hypothetical protein